LEEYWWKVDLSIEVLVVGGKLRGKLFDKGWKDY
jgi:hypothetical protein